MTMEQEASSLWAGVKKFEEILRNNPRAYSFAPLADLYRRLGLLDEALEIARRGCLIHPAFVAGQMALARVCLDKSLTSDARTALENVVSITPENLQAQRLLVDLLRSSGNITAAENCLQIIGELDPDFVFAVESQSLGSLPGAISAIAAATAPVDNISSVGFAHSEENSDEEEIYDAEILDLTDDLIEEEVFDDGIYAPFAAAPQRPSLTAKVTEEAPQFVDQEVTTAYFATEIADDHRGAINEVVSVNPESLAQPPVASATIAELYVSQGFIDKGIEVYRELLRENPASTLYKDRLDELTVGAASVATVASAVEKHTVAAPEIKAEQDKGPEGVVGILQDWLLNIGRVRACRTKSL